MDLKVQRSCNRDNDIRTDFLLHMTQWRHLPLWVPKTAFKNRERLAMNDNKQPILQSNSWKSMIVLEKYNLMLQRDLSSLYSLHSGWFGPSLTRSFYDKKTYVALQLPSPGKARLRDRNHSLFYIKSLKIV